ncbi:MAG: hypothetical protein AB1760_00015 [Pseudomonadota bacterium]
MSNDFYSHGVLFRVCSRCHKAFPLDAAHFYRDARQRRGFRAACRECAMGTASREKRDRKRARTEARVAELREKLARSDRARHLMVQLLKESVGLRLVERHPDLADMVRAYCRRMGLGNTEFARRVGVTTEIVENWVYGKCGVSPKHALDVLLYIGDGPRKEVAL